MTRGKFRDMDKMKNFLAPIYRPSYTLYMQEIKALDPEVVDQIAAGEVVERPAHMVKELIENSIDANATEIEVEFDHGGRNVRIKDNGDGIQGDQLGLALSRHATSKISTSADIWALHSFGFRGEALASIASVCHLTLISKPSNQEQACQIESQFGKISEVKEVGGEKGTTVFIEELFANVPARLKFLKSDAAEGTQIKNVLKALAMAHPQINFRVRNKAKLLYFWPAQENVQKRVQQILEQETMFVGEGECNGLRANVVLASPNVTTGNARQVWLFAQNRWVQDRTMQAAVLDAYRSLLMHGEFPIAVAWVETAAEDIDVNIHPAKSQVKFRNTSDAFRAVSRAARSILEQAPWLEDLLPHREVSDQSAFKNLEEQKNENFSLKMVIPEPKSRSFSDKAFERTQYSQKSFVAQDKFSPHVSQEDLQKLRVDEGDLLKPLGDYQIDEKTAHWSKLQVLGQSALTYIVSQSSESLVIIDQHAAHERVMYERLMKNWHQSDFEVQNYLMPLTIELEEDQVEALMAEVQNIERLSLSIDQLGPTSLGVRAAPILLKEKSIIKAISKLAKEIVDKGGSFAIEKNISDVLATLACHSVVRAGQALSQQEMISLLVQMDEFPMSSFCPHGRPVYVEYPFKKLEKDFGRSL